MAVPVPGEPVVPGAGLTLDMKKGMLAGFVTTGVIIPLTLMGVELLVNDGTPTTMYYATAGVIVAVVMIALFMAHELGVYL